MKKQGNESIWLLGMWRGRYMKVRLWTLLAITFFAQLAIAQTTHTFELDWSNPNAAYPICSSTLNTWCDVSMMVYETVGSSQNVITSSLNPLAISYLFPTYPTAGSHTYSVVENFKDLTGTILSTTAATATVNVPSLTGPPPVPITGLIGVPK